MFRLGAIIRLSKGSASAKKAAQTARGCLMRRTSPVRRALYGAPGEWDASPTHARPNGRADQGPPEDAIQCRAIARRIVWPRVDRWVPSPISLASIFFHFVYIYCGGSYIRADGTHLAVVPDGFPREHDDSRAQAVLPQQFLLRGFMRSVDTNCIELD